MISEELNKRYNCPECGGMIISIQEAGDTVCSSCGLVIDEKSIDFSHSGRRAFTSAEQQQRGRTGAPISILLPDMGLTTIIDKRDITNPDLKRAAKWNSRISWQKRNMLIATTELKRICSNLNLPEHIKRQAMYLYKQAFERKLLRGRSINGMVAACIYYAVRSERLPRSIQEILNETLVNPKEVRRCYRTIVRELKLKAPSMDLLSFVPKYMTELNLDYKIENTTIELINTFKSKISISGKDPKGIIAGAIYLACKKYNKALTQKEIADGVGVTEVTLRSRYKELAKLLNMKV